MFFGERLLSTPTINRPAGGKGDDDLDRLLCVGGSCETQDREEKSNRQPTHVRTPWRLHSNPRSALGFAVAWPEQIVNRNTLVDASAANLLGLRFLLRQRQLPLSSGGVMPLASATAQSDLSSVQGSNILINFTGNCLPTPWSSCIDTLSIYVN